MKTSNSCRAFVAGAILFCATTLALAQSSDDERYQKLEAEVQVLRQQMITQQEQHTREMAELKALLQKQAAPQEATPQTPEPMDFEPAAPSLYESLKQSAAVLVPQTQAIKGADLDMGVVLDFNAYHTDSSDEIGVLHNRIRGFEHNAKPEGPENGFNLRGVDIEFSAAVDPYFRAWTMVAVDEDGAGFEEVVIQSTSLPYGLTLSGGMIKSGIGRLNRNHAHDWDFFDAPLVYSAMFGEEGLADTGLQLTWLAPTPFYLLFGAEVFNGDSEQSFNVSDAAEMPQHDAPRLYTAFVKTGPDLGAYHALQFGLSALAGRQQRWDEQEYVGADGYSRIIGTDFVYKYDGKRSYGEGDFTLQGEYFYRDQDLDGRGDWAGTPWTAKQDGYYVQGLYGFLPRWRGGLRFDQIGLINDLSIPEYGSVTYGESSRVAAMLDWQLSEFSLLRAQAGRGWYEVEDGRKDVWEFALQWQVTFGKHGAHEF